MIIHWLSTVVTATVLCGKYHRSGDVLCYIFSIKKIGHVNVFQVLCIKNKVLSADLTSDFKLRFSVALWGKKQSIIVVMAG